MVALSWCCVRVAVCDELHHPRSRFCQLSESIPPLSQELQADIEAIRLDDGVRQGAIERIRKTRLLYESKERVGVNPVFRLIESSRGLSTHPPTALRLWLAHHVPPDDSIAGEC